MIVTDTQPFTVVDDKGFRAFVQKLDPTYQLPSRSTIKAMVERKYEEEKRKTIVELEKVSITADMWTSLNMDAYLGVTCHYVNVNDELSSVTLGVGHFSASHTAVNLSEATDALLCEYGIRSKIQCFITDNAANMVACARLLKLRHVPCFAHTLNLIVKKALDQTPELVDIRTKARKVIGFFKSSVRAHEKLAELQQQLAKHNHKLVQEVETRWNSTFSMFQRLFEQREPVAAAMTSLQSDITLINPPEYEIIEEAIRILGPFHIATTELSAEKHVTASKIIPMVRMLQHQLTLMEPTMRSNVTRQLFRHLHEGIYARCKVEKIRVLAEATLLDPRFIIHHTSHFGCRLILPLFHLYSDYKMIN